MNLIEQLGLEKCKQIVDGASGSNDETHYCAEVRDYIRSIDYGTCPHCILISDLRTAIASHGTPTNEGTDNLSYFDHCSDIANHISPLTKVTER